MHYAQPVIYMADDDEDDRYFMRQSLQQVYPSVTIIEAQDGSELLNLLVTWSQESTPQPVHMILLDMNMPKLNGLEALMAIKANPLLCHIPAVIFSTCAEPAQIVEAYQNGAQGYVKKPVSSLQMDHIVRSLSGYFLGEAAGEKGEKLIQ